MTNLQFNIVNYNRPLPPITIKDLNERSLFHERDSANPEIRDMFKNLGIIESYGTGVGEAKKACEESGSPKLYYKDFADNVDITSVVIPINKKYCELVGLNNDDLDREDQPNLIRSAIRDLIKNSHYSVTIKINMDKIYFQFSDTIFAAKDVIDLLGCSNNTATAYANRLIDLKIAEPVKGLGKGKYKFIN